MVCARDLPYTRVVYICVDHINVLWSSSPIMHLNKLRVFWEFLNNIPSICPLGKLRIFEDLFFTLLSKNPVGKVRVYSKKAHHFNLNIPSGKIESLIKENPPIYLWATVWKNPWVSFINLFKICPQYTWATHQRFFHNLLRICSATYPLGFL